MLFALVGLFVAGLPPGSAWASATPQADLWITNGPVYSSVLSGATLYIGGDFTYAGPETGHGVTVDTVTGEPNQFPNINGPVYAAAPDGAGGWYVGGTFTEVDGSAIYHNLVHIIPKSPGSTEMTVDTTFKPNISLTTPPASVDALLVSGSTLYVGGSFDSIDDGGGPVTRNNIAALDISTSPATLISAWNPDADGQVKTFLLSADNLSLYVGGAFTHFQAGVVPRSGVAALDADVATAGAPTAWDAAVAGTGLTVNAILEDPGPQRIYIGGNFSTVGGQARSNLAAVSSTDGALITTWAADTNGAVNAMVFNVTSNFIFAGGAFDGTSPINGKARDYLVKVDTDTGAVDDTWKPTPDGRVQTIEALGNNNLMVGGDFTSVDGTQRLHMVNILSSSAVSTVDPSTNGTVEVLKLAPGSNGGLFAGGDFYSQGGRERNHLAALDTATGAATDWNPGVTGTVLAIAPSTTAVYIGGDFSAVGGRARNHFAAIDPVTAKTMDGWDMNVDGIVHTMVLDGTTLYLGGEFTHVGADTRNRLAAFDTTGTALTSWAPSVDNTVNAMALFNDEGPVMYIGGKFSTVNGTTRHLLAAVDENGALTPWNPDVDTGNSVMALALSSVADDDVTDTKDSADLPPPILYIGGDFTHIDGAALNYIAAVNTDDSATLVSWDPGANMANAPVRSLALAQDNALLYAGGDFTAIGNQSSRAALSALTTDNGDATAWDPAPSASGEVDTLSLTPSGTLYAGGKFTRISGALRHQLAAFEAPTSSAKPVGSAYNTAQSVFLTCKEKTGTACTDNILYSVDGSVPTTAYASGLPIPIDTPNANTLDATVTLKYYATDSEGMREGINTETYIIDLKAPTVSASPAGNTYTAVQNVILTCVDEPGGSGCASVYYTTDGSDPTTGSTNSTKYTGAISLDNNTDLKFRAYDGAGNKSPVMEEQYTIDAFAPKTTPTPPPLTSPASYTVPQLVTLTCDDNGGFGCAGTYYTTDGSSPTTASTPYTQPILIDHNTTLNYFSIDKAGHAEAVTSAVYIIQTGIVVTSGGGLLLPPLYLLAAWFLYLGRIVYLRRRA